MSKTTSIYIASLILLSNILFSQNERSKWYFGQKAALDFMGNGPTALLNSQMNTPEGCASIADNAGNLLFYTNGFEVYTKNHLVMANGSNMPGGFSSVQSSLIIKDLQNTNLYHLFTTTDNFVAPLTHNIIDMSLAAGLGSVTTKNQILDASVGQRLHGTRHCNGRDWWVVAHRLNNSQFVAYLLTPSGLQTMPVVSAVGPTVTTLGTLKLAPLGNRLGLTYPMGTLLFDFNTTTGQVTNPLLLDTLFYYGCEFSPDGNRLYATHFQPYEVRQWSLCYTSDSSVLSSRTTILSNQSFNELGTMQIGPDKKIYIASGSNSVSVIHFPNLAGNSCSFTPQSVNLGNRMSGKSLPNFIVGFQRSQATVSSSVQCGQASFTYSLPPLPCTAPAYQPTSLRWRFDDITAGGKDTSSAQNPSYVYSKNGTYTVSLIINYLCASDTFKKIVSVTAIPEFTITGRSKICINEATTLIAAGANSYTWSGAQQTPTVTLNPSVTTIYTITGVTNGCQASKQHTVLVEPCVGMNSVATSQQKIYPTPARNYINIEGLQDQTIKIVDLLGNSIMIIHLQQPKEEIDVSHLPTGIYFLITASGLREKFLRE